MPVVAVEFAREFAFENEFERDTETELELEMPMPVAREPANAGVARTMRVDAMSRAFMLGYAFYVGVVEKAGGTGCGYVPPESTTRTQGLGGTKTRP